ncbi:MAG: sigma-70 family RNA polymerase sigma factor [Thermoleophilaceae bacterium]
MVAIMQATMRVEIDDETLVERARRGDAAAFEELVHRYADRLHAVVLRLVSNEHEAQEATQETFLRAWRGIARFKGESQFFTWLYRIGVNEANRRLKRGGANATDQSLDDLTHEPRDLRPGPAGQSEVHDLREALEAAVRALPPNTARRWSCATSRVYPPTRPRRSWTCPRPHSRVACTEHG